MKDSYKIGFAGIGVLGSATIGLLQSRKEELEIAAGRPLEIAGISGQDRNKNRDFASKDLTWYDSAVTMAEDPDLDLIVELIGGGAGSIADEIVTTALVSGKRVVSANKALLSERGNELAALVEEKQSSIGYEAAIAGGIPAVKALKDRVPANKISRIYGILNGTCNYILSRMEADQLSFEACLDEAQRLGYAEANPTFDIDGFDAAYKISLLATLAFGTKVNFDAVSIKGVREVELADIRRAADLGYRIKLLGVATWTPSGIEQKVHPVMIPRSSPLAEVNGVLNAVGWDDDLLGTCLMTGPGAGGAATSSSIIADIIGAARGDISPLFDRPAALLQPMTPLKDGHHQSPYYLHMLVKDELGAFAKVAQSMADHGISLSTIVQQAAEKGDQQSHRRVMIITHETAERSISDAVTALTKSGVIDGNPRIFPIEKVD